MFCNLQHCDVRQSLKFCKSGVRRTKQLRPVVQYAKTVLPDWGRSSGLGLFSVQVAILSINYAFFSY